MISVTYIQGYIHTNIQNLLASLVSACFASRLRCLLTLPTSLSCLTHFLQLKLACKTERTAARLRRGCGHHNASTHIWKHTDTQLEPYMQGVYADGSIQYIWKYTNMASGQREALPGCPTRRYSANLSDPGHYGAQPQAHHPCRLRTRPTRLSSGS